MTTERELLIESRISTVETNVKDLKQDSTEIRSDVKSLIKETSSLKTYVKILLIVTGLAGGGQLALKVVAPTTPQPAAITQPAIPTSHN